MDPDNDWKQRYYTQIERLEQQEQRWQEIERFLRQAVSRLTLLGADIDDRVLNGHLHALRAAIRNEADSLSLQPLIDAVSDDLRRLEQGEPASEAGDETAPAPPAEAASDAPPADDDRAALDALVSQATREMLIELLERLPVSSECVASAHQLKERLLGGVDSRGMPAIVAGIADLIAGMRQVVQQERRELEQFLRQITQRLQELDRLVAASLDQHEAAIEAGADLDRAVQAEVSGIRSSAAGAADLITLRAMIEQRLSTITEHVTEHVANERQRAEQERQRAEALAQRLKTMEQETDSLRDRVRQESQRALIDPLTGIPNRLAWNERVGQEAARFRRYGTPLSVLVWDIDRFKQINDTYGHLAGDNVLKIIARTFRELVRDTDFLARYGGEEFVILMPETDLAEARSAAEKLRAAVEACKFHYKGKRVPITASGGLASFTGEDTPESVFARADAALYRAKGGGRNRVEVDGHG